MNSEATTQEAQYDQALELVKSFLEDLLHRIEPTLLIDIRREDAKIFVELNQTDIFAEREGASIQSLEHLADLHLRRNLREDVRVQVDIANFRERRINELRQTAHELSEQVLELNQIARMEPMTAWERKVVHETLEKIETVRTYSEGSIERHVVIAPQRKDKKGQAKQKSAD